MTTVEPRIAERRRQVTEDRARRRLIWMVVALLVVVMAACAYWLVRSSFLSLESVHVEGALHSDPTATAESVGVVRGLPLISIDEQAIAEALATDPWVAGVDVRVRWPRSLVITVEERRAAAVITDGSSFAIVATDGMVVATVGNAPDAIHIDTRVPPPGSTVRDGAVLGVVEFVAALDDETAAATVVTIEAGTVSAVVLGHPVRLGRAVDMDAKARALQAVLATNLVPDASIDLIAPSFPAVANPQSQVEGEDESQPEGEAGD